MDLPLLSVQYQNMADGRNPSVLFLNSILKTSFLFYRSSKAAICQHHVGGTGRYHSTFPDTFLRQGWSETRERSKKTEGEEGELTGAQQLTAGNPSLLQMLP